MLFPAEQAFVGRDEKGAPLKTPAWEATIWADKLLTFREAILKPRFDGRRIFEVDSCFVETNWYKLD